MRVIKTNLLLWLKSLRPALVFQTGALLVYALLGTFSFGFPRAPYAFIASVGSATTISLLINYIRQKKLQFSNGSLIAAISFYLLVESPRSIIPYLFGGAVGQLSKYFFVIDKKPIFNPSNFAVLVTLYCLSSFVAYVPDQWNSSISVLAIIVTLGATVSWIAGRTTVAVSYFMSFACIAAIRAAVSGVSFLFYGGTLIGVPQAIFTFHMITDPKTSPSDRKEQVLFGASIGLLEGILRWNLFFYPSFLALVLVCAVWPLVPLKRRPTELSYV